MSSSKVQTSSTTTTAPSTSVAARLVIAWTVVGVPLAYGLWQTLVKAFQLLG